VGEKEPTLRADSNKASLVRTWTYKYEVKGKIELTGRLSIGPFISLRMIKEETIDLMKRC
jgi:hypothetical protein